MTEQPEALLIADNLGKPWTLLSDQVKAAAELRRLHALNAELLEALKNIVKEFEARGRGQWPEAVKARATIAKIKGEKK